MKNWKQILIILGGIAIAVLLIASTTSNERWQSEFSRTTQKKPHSPADEQGFQKISQ